MADQTAAVEALRLAALEAQAEVVDLICRIRFMRSAIDSERKKAKAIRGLLCVYETEAANAQ